MDHDVPIGDESIRLGQFLKLSSLIDSGSDAKSAIAGGLVTVSYTHLTLPTTPYV